MKRPSSLNKSQLAKFIEGYNLLIRGGDQKGVRGYKQDGMEFARTIVLNLQLNGIENAHSRVPTINASSNLNAIETMWYIAATRFGYQDMMGDK